MEGFVFRNSYKETSPVFLVGATYSFLEVGPVDLRLGGGIGTAYYEILSSQLKDQGIPNWNGYIPFAVGTLQADTNYGALRLSVTPTGSAQDRAYNLSTTVKF